MASFFSRIQKICILFGMLTVLLAARLVYLQAVVSPQLAAAGLMSRVNERGAELLRGNIFDRHMRPLTGRDRHFELTVFPGQVRDADAAARLLARQTGADENALKSGIARANRPVRLPVQIGAETAAALRGAAPEGIAVSEETARYGLMASHVVGYANRADNRGICGVEALCDAALRAGEKRDLAALVDARAEMIPGLGYRTLRLPVEGDMHSVVLTLDERVQMAAEAVFDRYATKGAVVVMEPRSGEILAMVSRPNFSAEQIGQYLNAPDSPLLNRAVTAYQPGSVFKLVTAIAALEKGLVKPEDTFYDPGYIDVNGTVIKRWDSENGARHLTFRQAMAYSSNPVLIDVGLKIGMRGILEYARKLGFGEKTALNFPNEGAGNLPEADKVYRGETANLSIGQGQCEATPVQMASLVAAIVNDGIETLPSIVDRICDADGNVVERREPSAKRRLFSAATARAVRDMMKDVNDYGTGQAAYVERGGSAGKTGSAETGRKDSSGKGISHAWYAGYAPLERPTYAVVVFVEDGMSGGDLAAPIFREIVERLES